MQRPREHLFTIYQTCTSLIDLNLLNSLVGNLTRSEHLQQQLCEGSPLKETSVTVVKIT